MHRRRSIEREAAKEKERQGARNKGSLKGKKRTWLKGHARVKCSRVQQLDSHMSNPGPGPKAARPHALQQPFSKCSPHFDKPRRNCKIQIPERNYKSLRNCKIQPAKTQKFWTPLKSTVLPKIRKTLAPWRCAILRRDPWETWSSKPHMLQPSDSLKLCTKTLSWILAPPVKDLYGYKQYIRAL